MIKLTGKFSDATVFTDNLDVETTTQILGILNSEVSKGSIVKMMPDTHAGQGGPIGLTMTLHDIVAPSLVGSDIGCGVTLFKFDHTGIDFTLEKLDKVIHNNVPAGFKMRQIDLTDVNATLSRYLTNYLTLLLCDLRVVKKGHIKFDDVYNKAIHCIGTLGGGNHFIEAYKGDTDNETYLSIHTGSRTLGGVIYRYYNSKTVNHAYVKFLQDRQDIIAKLKSEGRMAEIKSTLDKHSLEAAKNYNFNDGYKYLIGQDAEDYIHDVDLLTRFAFINRDEIFRSIVEGLGLNINHTELIADKPHNYIDGKTKTLRKGAQSSIGKVLIPINMRDGMIVGHLDNFDTSVEWNHSAPHGAGRRLTRTAAKSTLDVEDFKSTMSGIYSTTISVDTIDEAPDAYKPLDEIKKNIEGHIHIVKILKPIYNFKGGSEKFPGGDEMK